MQTNNKSIIITIAAVLVAAFFMPWLKFFVNLSAWDMIFGEAGQYIDTGFKYIALIIPISAIIVIYGSAFNNENYPISRGLLFRLPILTLIALTIAIASKIGESGGRIRSSDLEDLIKVFGIGFWLTLVGSIILPFLQSNSYSPRLPTQHATYSGTAKVGMAIAVIGLILIIISTQNQLFTKSYRYRVDPGAQGLPDAYNLMGPVYDTQTYIDKKKKNTFLYSGLGALILGGLLFASGRSTTNLSNSKPQVPISDNSQNQHTSPPVNIPNYTRPQININLPKINWGKAKSFISKYKALLISGLLLLIAFIVVYNLFIKADPVKDGKHLAKSYCTCSEELNKNNLASMKSYYDDFDNKKFKSRIEARNSLNGVTQENQSKYNNCTQSVDIKYKERLADYNSKGDKNAYTFQQTYNSIISSCNSNNNSDVVALQNKIDGKISSIIDPEPDIERIKSDLMGRQILGWKFNYLSEIKQASIANKTTAPELIEYTIDLHLVGQGQPESNYNDAQVITTYFLGEQGWYLSSLKDIFITYINIAPPDKWQTVTPLSNSTYTISCDKRYLIRDGAYGQTYKGGPDGESFHLTNSTLYISSRETEPTNVIFTYKPNQ